MSSFSRLWDDLKPNQNEPIYQRIDDEHILDFYIGCDITGEKLLLLISDQEPPKVRQSQSINIRIAKRKDGRWILLFRLVKPEHSQVFMLLCEDMVNSSRGVADPSKGASFVLSRFYKWQKLLESGHSGLLDENSIRGLIGELIFMEQYAIPRYGNEQAIESWLGPTGADQDYVFNDYWYEVKTIHSGTSVVKISSVEQLDGPGLGELVVIYLDGTSQIQPRSISLYDIVLNIKASLAEFPLSYTLFEDKLLSVGYIEREEYKEQCYIFNGMKRYRVIDEFPRFTRSHLPSGIKNIIYELEITKVDNYEQV